MRELTQFILYLSVPKENNTKINYFWNLKKFQIQIAATEGGLVRLLKRLN